MVFSSSLLIGAALMGSIAGQPLVTAAHYRNHADYQLLSQRDSTVYLNRQCRRTAEGWNQELMPLNTWRVAHRQSFMAQGREYWFVYGMYQDGASLLCVTLPGYKNGWRLNIPTLQSQFIGDIQRESNAKFLIIVNGGNGRVVPMTKYRLNLSNPETPQWTVLSRWTGPPADNPSIR